MSNLARYRLCETADPEERLEDAVMWKALHDALGERIEMIGTETPAPEDGLFLGRGRTNEPHENLLSAPGLSYWDDPAFTRRCGRMFFLADLEKAWSETRRLLDEGRPVFLKSTAQKHYARLFTDCEDFEKEMGGMAYSFMDRGRCLMVQEGVEMRHERRLLVIDREVVTQSPVAWHLTPMDRAWFPEANEGRDIEDMHFRTPGDRDATHSPELTRRMTDMAQGIARDSAHEHLCIDLCVLGEDMSGPIEPVEWNPMQPGAVGLYACDPRRVAEAVARHLDRYPDRYPGLPLEEAPREATPFEIYLQEETWTDEDEGPAP